jgi:RNA-directed DNA polymerase
MDKTEPTTEEARLSQCPHDIKLTPWKKLCATREKLRLKAKQEPKFRFYSLYHHIIHRETLEAAFALVARNGGACGVDGVTIASLRENPMNEIRFLDQLEKELREKTYRPEAVKRVYIPKPCGKLRPLGIPTIRDRVVQCAVKLIIEPIFEEDFKPCSHGFRPGKRAHDAIQAVADNLRQGRVAVYDADLSSYFDTIPHDLLIEGLRMRIVDGSVLGLILMWLNAPVMEPPSKDKRGRPQGPPKIHRPKAGTPQGGVLSPLLANLHLHWFDRAFYGTTGPGTWANATLTRYADDFVIQARYVGDRIVNWIEEKIEGRLGLKINREKTSVKDLSAPSTRLDFLGYSFRWDRSFFGSGKYWNLFPSPKTVERERAKISEMVSGRKSCVPPGVLAEGLMRHLRGWKIYFSLGYPRDAFNKINYHVYRRFSRYCRRRSQRGTRMPEGESSWTLLRKSGFEPL